MLAQLLLLATVPWLTNAQLTAVNVGTKGDENVAAGQYKNYIFIVPASNSAGEPIPESLVTIRVSPTRGNPDLFVNRDASYPATIFKHGYKSTASGTLEREAVAFVAVVGTRVHLSVYGQEYSEFNVQIAAEAFVPETLTSGQGGSYEVVFSSRKYFRVDVPATLSELAFSFTSDNIVLMNTRPTSTLVFEIPEYGAQVAPVYYDETFAELRNGSAYSKREVTYANTRGLSTASKIYLAGPRIVYLHVSGGLHPLEVGEDTTLPFSLRVDVKAAKVVCVNGTQPLDSGPQSLSFGELHFYSIHVPKSWPYLHLGMLNLVNKADMLLGYSVDFPLSDSEAFLVLNECGNCIQTHARHKLAARPGNWPETATWKGAPKGSCSDISTISDTPAFMHVVVRSAATVGRTSEYRMVAWGLDNDCGWRPSCQACSNAASMCSWCNTGGTHGFCGAKDIADISGFPQSTCRNSYCPIADLCSGRSSCGDCTQIYGCGWCANAEHGGVCMSDTGSSSLGPPAGTCDAWLTNPNSDCAAACAVHDIAKRPCAACALDAGCGYCQSSVAGGSCSAGTIAGAATGQCPHAGAKWAFGSVSACTTAGADDVNRNTSSAVSIFIGGAASVGILNRGNEACAIGACRSAMFVVEVLEEGPYDLLATLEITGTSGINNVTNAEIIRAGVRLLARYDRVPQAAEGEHDVRGIEMTLTNDSSVLAAPLGICDSKGTKAYFAVQLVHPPPANLGTLSVLNFKLKLQRRSSTLDIAPLGAITTLAPDWTCCGQRRHVSLKLPPGTEKSLAVKVKTIGTEGLRVMTRKGACPTSKIADQDSGATGSVVMTLDPPPATASVVAAAAVQWHVAIMGETRAGAGKVSFAISAVEETSTPPAGPISSSNTTDDYVWMSNYRWYFFGLACAMVATVIGVAGVMIYRRSRRIMTPSNALALTSDSLAYDLEMAGKPHVPAVNPLAIHSPSKRKPTGNPLAIMATSEQTSEAEEQLVTLIMDLQSKIDKLETENIALKEENKFRKVATGAVKARRVAKAVAELVRSGESISLITLQGDTLPVGSMAAAAAMADEYEETGMSHPEAPPQQAEPLTEMFSENISVAATPAVALPSLLLTSAAPVTYAVHQDANTLFDEPAGAIAAELKSTKLDPKAFAEGLDENLNVELSVLSVAPVTPAPTDSTVSVLDLPAKMLNANVTKAAVNDISEIPVFSSTQRIAEEASPALALKVGQRGAESASPSEAFHSFFVICPDGTTLDVKTERQVLGRGIGGIRSKKVSREQAQVAVNFANGTIELEMLGKNPGATRSKGANVDWLPLHRGVRRSLSAGDEFLLLAADANMTEGDKDDARTQVFSLVQVPPGRKWDWNKPS